MNADPHRDTMKSGVPPPRQFEVHIAGGRHIHLKVAACDFEDMGRRMMRDRFLIGVIEAAHSDDGLGRTVLIPANRIDYVVDLDE